MEQDDKKIFIINLLYFVSIAGIIYFVLKFMLLYLLPFIIGGIIAYLVQKPSRFISKKTKIPKNNISAFSAVFLYIYVVAHIVLIIYLLIKYSKGFFNDLPLYINKITAIGYNFRLKINESLKDISPEFLKTLNNMIDNQIENIFSSITNFFSLFTGNVAKKAPSIFLSAVVTVVASCFLAKDYDILLRFFNKMAGHKIYKNVLKIKNILVECVFKYIKGYLILMGITFLELTIGFIILKYKYAWLIALIISIVDILPVFGCGTVLIPWALFEIFNGNIALAIKILIIYIIISIIRNFLEPKIIGKQMGMNPLLSLLSMFVGIKLFGFFGLVLLPITVIVVIKYYKNEIEEEKLNKNHS